MSRQIILDTETTGFKPSDGHRLIEIGCVEMINRELTGNHFHHYINPGRDIDAGAQAVHGITEKFLIGKPVFAEILPELLTFIRGAELIIHNAPFDVGFLNHEFQLADSECKRVTDICQIFDTLTYARKKHPGQKNNLDALCNRYQVNNKHRELHGAMLDATLLAHVYLAMTGGQKQLFEEETQSTLNVSATNIRRVEARGSKKVIRATAEELEAHEKLV